MKSVKYLLIGFLSLSVLSVELFWTRLFSAEFYYTFAFLILSLAVMGLGLGALAHKLFAFLRKPASLSVCLALSAFFVLFAVPTIFYLELDFTKLISEPVMILKLVIAIKLLGLGYFFAGIALAHIFSNNAKDITKLYMFDLVFAALGVVLFIIFMNSFGPLFTYFFCAVPLLTASLIAAKRYLKLFPILVFFFALFYMSTIDELPEQKREERAKVISKHWDASAKIKVYEYDSTARGINIDNVANSPVNRFDGDWNIPDSLKSPFPIDVGYLMNKFEGGATFLSLGAGGGSDVLQALAYNAKEVHAVEVIPYINYMMTEGELAEFSGHIYTDPRVKVITDDARAYIRQFDNKFDIIYSLSSNSWASFASGAFALAENYIFTTEAFIDYWNSLTEKGYMSIEHQFYAPRLTAELMEALKELKVENPEKHFAIYNLPSMKRKLLLVSKQPLTNEIIQNCYGPLQVMDPKMLSLLYPTEKENVYNSIVKYGWENVADTVPVDISPCCDDKPFVAQLGLMKNVDFSQTDKIPMYEFTGFPLAKLIIIIILVVSIVIFIPLNLIPYVLKTNKMKFTSWLYFFFLGMAFMMVEVILIQKYALFIGSSIYSFALVLTVLLVSSGLGSRKADKHSAFAIFTMICLWLLLDVFVFRQLFYVLGASPLGLRMVIAGLFIFPLGYFMGMPFPKAALKTPDTVDWAFAVNGSASVIGSALIMLIAFGWGYSVALISALVLYLVAGLLFGKVKAIEK